MPYCISHNIEDLTPNKPIFPYSDIKLIFFLTLEGHFHCIYAACYCVVLHKNQSLNLQYCQILLIYKELFTCDIDHSGSLILIFLAVRNNPPWIGTATPLQSTPSLDCPLPYQLSSKLSFVGRSDLKLLLQGVDDPSKGLTIKVVLQGSPSPMVQIAMIWVNARVRMNWSRIPWDIIIWDLGAYLTYN